MSDVRPTNVLASDGLLGSSEATFNEQVFDSLPGIIYIYNPVSKKLRFINKGLTEALGHTPEDIQRHDHDHNLIIHPEDRELVQKELETIASMNDSDSHSYRCRFNHKAGEWMNLNVIGKVLRRESSGKAVSLLLIAQNISDQIHTDADRETIRDLNAKIAQLTHANEELEEFAFAASHDLQEPLRKIATMATWLHTKFGEGFTAEGKQYLERIQSAAKNARILIDSLIKFSQIDRETFNIQGVNLEEVVREVMFDLELILEETHTTITLGPLPRLEISHPQAKQLLSNIILNSIKFRKKDCPAEITISSRPLGEPEIQELNLNAGFRYQAISLQDNGIGFDNAYAPGIFQMFRRLNGKSEYPGAGIGLAICKRIVENYHGLITAKGTPGVGAEFTIILPDINQPGKG